MNLKCARTAFVVLGLVVRPKTPFEADAGRGDIHALKGECGIIAQLYIPPCMNVRQGNGIDTAGREEKTEFHR
jgi:hypothetical protein